MSAHSEIERHLTNRSKTFSGATAGISTLTQINTTFSHQELKELIRVVEASGHEIVLAAGSLKVRPKDSSL